MGELAVVGVYFSPNISLADFEAFLARVGAVVTRPLPSRVISMRSLRPGDSPCQRRCSGGVGSRAGPFSSQQRLSPYVRAAVGGGSIVDISFASPAAARLVMEW